MSGELVTNNQLPSVVSARASDDDFAMAEVDKTIQPPPVVRMNHDKATWRLLGEDVAMLTGYALGKFYMRNCYGKPYKPGDRDREPPICSAVGQVAATMAPPEGREGNQSDACASCQWSQFGTAFVGEGQRCQLHLYVVMWLANTGELATVEIPSSSLRLMERQSGALKAEPGLLDLAGMRAGGGRYPLACLEMTLEETDGANCVVRGRVAGVVGAPEEKAALKAYYDAAHAWIDREVPRK